MKHRMKLFSSKFLYDSAKTEDLFFRAIKENCAFHYDRCAEYRAVLDGFDFHPNDLKSYADIAKIPPIPTLFYKNHSVFSLPRWRVLLKGTSSGTKNKFSRVGLSASDMYCGFLMILHAMGARKMFSATPTHYIILGYKPHKSNKTSVTKSVYGSTFFAPAISRTFALKHGKNGYTPDLEGIIASLEKHGESRFPIRFIGFPSYAYFVLKIMDERGIRLKTHSKSKVILSGGWKQFYAEQVDKSVIYELIYRVLDIAEENIVEFFSAVEHPALYCDCPKHHFHVPAYSRVIIRDVHTLEPVENGKIGLINLLTPISSATPITGVMTDDLGILHDAGNCDCGLKSPYLEIIGRVGLKDIKTCAAGAAELMKGVEL